MTKKRVVSRRTFVDPAKVGSTRPAGSTKRVLVKTTESTWNCTSCGTKGIAGRIKICPSCQNPKGSDEEYQESSSSAPALTRHELGLMGVDANHFSDQTCDFCGAKSIPGSSKCTQCGAPLADVARTDRVCENCGTETIDGVCPSCNASTRTKNQAHRQSVRRTGKQSPQQVINWKVRRTASNLDVTNPAIWGPALGLLIIALIAFIFWPRQAEVRVESVSWQATVSLQEYQYNQHSGWSLPSGADLVSTEQKEHHTVSVQQGTKTEHYTEKVCGSDIYDYTEVLVYDDGTTDTIDHYKPNCWDEPRTREVPNMVDEPVYQTYYTYMQWEWANISPAVATGSNYEPYWPTGFLIDDKHRESGRQMNFSVSLVEMDGDDDFTYRPSSLEEYRTFNLNSMWHITHSGGHITEIERIER